jgi:hypothetical protein
MNRKWPVPAEWSPGPQPVPAGQKPRSPAVPSQKTRSLYATTPEGGGVAAVRDHPYRNQNPNIDKNRIEAA